MEEFGDLQQAQVYVWVFGAFGEASAGVHALAQELSQLRVKAKGLGLGKGGRQLEYGGAVAVAAGLVRRRLFTVAVREHAGSAVA